MAATIRFALLISLCASLAWAQDAPPTKTPPQEESAEKKPVATKEPVVKTPAEKSPQAADGLSSAPARSSDPAAVGAFRALIAKLYRPHEQGLASLEARVAVTRSALASGSKATEAGPWIIRWTDDHQAKVTDIAGKPVRGNFQRIVGDLVGFRPEQLIKDRELRLDDAGRVLLGAVPAEGAAFTPLTAFLADKKGRLGTQFIFQGPRPAMRRRYFYRSRGDHFLVHRTMVRTLNAKGELQGESSITYDWAEVGGFSFPKSIVTVGGNVRQIVEYSQIKPKRRVAPKSPKPDTKAPTPTPPGQEKGAGSAR